MEAISSHFENLSVTDKKQLTKEEKKEAAQAKKEAAQAKKDAKKEAKVKAEEKFKTRQAKNAEKELAIFNITGIRLTAGETQTKKWRQEQDWWFGGKVSECEKYQRRSLEKVIGQTVSKTNLRLHKRKHNMQDKRWPKNEKGGNSWTEDFDGMFVIEKTRYLVDFKSTVESGGAQTRTIREGLAPFITAQLDYLVKHPEDTNTRFVNLLDGEILYKETREAYETNKASLWDDFDLPEYKNVKTYVYVGDTLNFCHKYINK